MYQVYICSNHHLLTSRKFRVEDDDKADAIKLPTISLSRDDVIFSVAENKIKSNYLRESV